MDIEKIMPSQLSVQTREVDFVVDEEFETKLESEGFIIVETEEKSFTFLEANSRIS